MTTTDNIEERKKQIEIILVDRWLSGGFKEFARQVSESESDIKILFELNDSADEKIAWRSAYIIDMVHDYKKEAILPYLTRIAEKAPHVKNHSIKRHYCRILAQHDLSELASGSLLDSCFEWLQMQEIPIAVKAHCMMILYNLCEEYPELIPELKAVLENLIPYGSKGEVNRAKSILKQLNKIQKK